MTLIWIAELVWNVADLGVLAGAVEPWGWEREVGPLCPGVLVEITVLKYLLDINYKLLVYLNCWYIWNL